MTDMDTVERTGHIAMAVVEPEGFAEYLAAARARMPAHIAAYVTPFTAEELRSRHALCLVSADNASGFAVAVDGALLGLFSTVRGRGRALVRSAIDHGATWLECFAGYLPALYASEGFKHESRVAFDWALAPAGWQAEWGTPDYITMRLRADHPGAWGCL